jgi:aspartate aminotransferase
MYISRRVATLRTSTTIAVTNLARELRRQGQDVLSFAAGEPDFDTPEPIKRAAIDALLAGQTKYLPTLGDPETRAVIAEKVSRTNGIPNVTPDHIAISCGGKHALYSCFQCLLDPPGAGREAQEVLLPVPAWVSYQPLAELAGGRIVELPTSAATGFKISPAQLRAAITPRSRLLMLNSPSNPCATMYTPDELRALAAVVAEAACTIAPELVIMSDEIYEKIVYGGVAHFSIGSVAEVAERTITINGLSKAFAMTGWRVGYAAASGEFGLKFMKAMGVMQGQMTTNITSFVYPAIRVALTQCADSVERMRQAFAHRAEIICARMGRVPGLPAVRPTGAFYLFPNITAHFGKRSKGGRPIKNCGDFCEALLSEHKVAAVPGDDFGGVGKDHVRFSFACSEEQINRGMDRLGEFVAGLR